MSLILPPGVSPTPEPEPDFQPYDSELLEIEKLLEWLSFEFSGKKGNLESANQTIKGKFEEAGFDVDVKWYTSKNHGFVPEVQLNGRLSKEAFDPDRMTHEVTNDILGIDGINGGVIKSNIGS